MPVSLTLSTGLLFGFLLVLSRVAGIFVFVPLPGLRAAPEPVRAVLALAVTLALFPRWPAVDPAAFTPFRLTGWMVAEAAVGAAIGLVVAVVLEGFSVAAQVLGLQAGYAYASTIDPNTQADSGVLLVFSQLAAALLFVAAGLDRELVRLVARSLETAPPGAWAFSGPSAAPVIRLTAGMFQIGLRLAFPVVALLVMVDIAMALAGRIHSQLQLLSLAFPAKMLAALAMLSWCAVLFPRILRESCGTAWSVLRHLLGL
jgi:flagellar biosynthesis protein FliR